MTDSKAEYDSTFPFSFAPGLVIGHRKNGQPIYLVAGGAEDDDFDSTMSDEDESGDEGEEEEEEDDNDVEDKTEPKEKPKEDPKDLEIDRLKKRLAKTRQESASRRKRIEDLTKSASDSKSGDEAEIAVTTARQEGYSEAENKYKGVLYKVAGKAALMEAGVKPAKAKRALKLIDFDDVEIDDDGDISGIEDAIEDLKEDWPELFVAEKDEEDEPAPVKPRVKSSQVNGAGRTTRGDKKPKTATEVALDRLMGKR